MGDRMTFSMTTAWAEDFTYSYYRRLLETASTRFECRLFSEAPDAVATGTNTLLLRHDVDLDLSAALAMAEVEHEFGFRSTFMVMTACPLYSVRDQASRRILAELVNLGHEIGLHFDAHQSEETSPGALEVLIARDCDALADAAGAPVPSVSFHRPQPAFLRGNLIVGGRVNAYARELMDAYFSDSKGSWRGGEPIGDVRRTEASILQLLTHPIWWDTDHAGAAVRLERLFRRRTSGSSPEQSKQLDRDLAETVPAVTRQGRLENEGVATL